MREILTGLVRTVNDGWKESNPARLFCLQRDGLVIRQTELCNKKINIAAHERVLALQSVILKYKKA